MKDLSELIGRLSEERPVDWDKLPDIELYRDQVLGYMKRQHSLLPDEEQLTGAMINNYIKSGLLPRANSKKYTKDHLVYLTAICSLKQVLSVGDTDRLMKHQDNISNAHEFYEEFLKQLNEAFLQTSEQLKVHLKKETDNGELAATAMRFAISGYVQKLVCEKILDILKEREIRNNAGKKSLKKV
jgi:Domain of unknown function (DUF1836).